MVAAISVSGVTPIGQNFQVNTLTYGDQIGHSVSRLGSIKFVVTWADTSIGQMVAQIFDSNGRRLGTPFNLFPTGYSDNGQFELPDGRVVVYAPSGIARIIGVDGTPDGAMFSTLNELPGYTSTTALVGGAL